MYVGNITLGNENKTLNLNRIYTRVNIMRQSGSNTGSVGVQLGMPKRNTLFYDVGEDSAVDLTQADLLTLNTGASGEIAFDKLKFMGAGLTGEVTLYICAFGEQVEGVKENELVAES